MDLTPWCLHACTHLLTQSIIPCLEVVGPAAGCPPIGPKHDECVNERKANQSRKSSTGSGTKVLSSETGTAGTGSFQNNADKFDWWMLLTAAGVAGAVIGVHMGQRKNNAAATDSHEMQGSISRRFGAVSALAAGALTMSGGKSQVEPAEDSVEKDGILLDGDIEIPAAYDSVEA